MSIRPVKFNPDLKVPFDKAGNLLHWTGYHEPEWRPNAVFVVSLSFKGFRRGRSSVIANFEACANDRGPVQTHMSLADFETIVDELKEGHWRGTAFYKKVGDSYFLTQEIPMSDRDEHTFTYISSEHLRQMAYEVAEAGREKGVKRALVGLTVEQVLQIAEQLQELEDAHQAADSAIFDDTTQWPDSEEDVH